MLKKPRLSIIPSFHCSDPLHQSNQWQANFYQLPPRQRVGVKQRERNEKTVRQTLKLMPVADRIIQLNLIAAWSGILAGFVSGLLLGLFFHREDWLGGFGSFKRRLYRLAHISLFGLAIVNLMFYFTA